MKIYTASISPKGIELAAEMADGVIPVWMSPAWYAQLYQAHLEAGFKKAGGGKSIASFDLAPYVPVHMGNDLDQCRAPVKASLALYIGGMGARNRNFYNSYVRNFGYEELATQLQDLYLSGRKEEAAAAVPDKLVDAVALIGPRERIKDQLAAWKASPVNTMIVGTARSRRCNARSPMLRPAVAVAAQPRAAVRPGCYSFPQLCALSTKPESMFTPARAATARSRSCAKSTGPSAVRPAATAAAAAA